MTRYQIQISARLLSWPRKCACCGRTADTELRATATRTTGKRVVRTNSRWWEVPYCSQCVGHIRKYRSANSGGGVALMLAVLIIVFGLGSGSGWGVAVAAALLVGLFVARSKRAKRIRAEARSMMVPNCCASPDVAVEYVEWYSTSHTFVFSSQQYLDAFVLANHQKTQSDVRRVT